MVSKGRPLYRVLQTVVLSSDRRIYEPGAIVDLSHLPAASIRWFVERGYYETADGEPANEPGEPPAAGDDPAKPCVGCGH